jgi:hypothetical protein
VRLLTTVGILISLLMPIMLLLLVSGALDFMFVSNQAVLAQPPEFCRSFLANTDDPPPQFQADFR